MANKEASRKWYLANMEKVKRAAKETQASRMRFVRAVKSYPCEDCDTFWPPCAMQFDHRDPSQKVNVIGKMATSRSFSALVEEIMKCDLVCANCHAIRTHDC